MNQKPLVRHPAPEPTESIYGYLLRLGEVNGYEGMAQVLRLAGIKNEPIYFTSEDFVALASVVQQPVEALQRISMSQSGDRRLLLGHVIHRGQAAVTNAAVCVDCIVERGFIEAFWHLDLVSVCPIHRCLAPYFCSNCKKRITWKRKSMLRCRCGAAIVSRRKSGPSVQEIELMDLIRFSTCRDTRYSESESGLPYEQLLELPLSNLLYVVRTLGERGVPREHKSFGAKMVPAAARFLADWPKNYIALLQKCSGGRLRSPEPPADLRDISRQLGGALSLRPVTESPSGDYNPEADMNAVYKLLAQRKAREGKPPSIA